MDSHQEISWLSFRSRFSKYEAQTKWKTLVPSGTKRKNQEATNIKYAIISQGKSDSGCASRGTSSVAQLINKAWRNRWLIRSRNAGSEPDDRNYAFLMSFRARAQVSENFRYRYGPWARVAQTVQRKSEKVCNAFTRYFHFPPAILPRCVVSGGTKKTRKK